MGPIQAKTRTIKATFSLEESVDLFSLDCSFDLEQELLNILREEMLGYDEFKPMKIEIEEYE
jgi:hypothetical protein